MAKLIVRPVTVQTRFEEYHERNPEVFELFVQFTREVMRSGYEHYGAWATFQRIRWHIDMETHQRDGFKISNDYISRYVRMLETVFPEYSGFYKTRPLKVA